MSIYDYKVKEQDGTEISMDRYKGQVLLIVNTATGCGFTPQYTELQEIYEEFRNKGLEILDFPCNQFGNQAPGSTEEIVSFCDARFGITFTQFEKIEVNGKNAHPLYQYLKEQKGFEGFDEDHPLTPMLKSALERIDADYKNNSDIKWNFTKFLIDRNGTVVKRFEPTADIADVEQKITELL